MLEDLFYNIISYWLPFCNVANQNRRDFTLFYFAARKTKSRGKYKIFTIPFKSNFPGVVHNGRIGAETADGRIQA